MMDKSGKVLKQGCKNRSSTFNFKACVEVESGRVAFFFGEDWGRSFVEARGSKGWMNGLESTSICFYEPLGEISKGIISFS